MKWDQPNPSPLVDRDGYTREPDLNPYPTHPKYQRPRATGCCACDYLEHPCPKHTQERKP